MLRIASLIALLILFGAGPVQAAESCVYRAAETHGHPALKRGINLSRWWEDDRNQAPTPDDIKNIRDLGFDFVRLPLSPQGLEAGDSEQGVQRLAQLRCDIISLLNENLSVIVDLHAPGGFQRELAQEPDEAAGRLEKLWRQMLPVLKDLPADRVLLGLYNEPHIDAAVWWRIQGRLVHALRSHFPDNAFVVTAGPDGGPWNLENAMPYDDRNIIYDFHYYQPLILTHHAAAWLPSYDPRDKGEAISYPVTSAMHADHDDAVMYDYITAGWNRAKLAAAIGKIAAWGMRNHAQIGCFEFGVYRPYVSAGSRLNWLRDMRELLEQDRIPWALWEYRGGFGLNDNGTVDQPMANALGLRHNSAP